ncbi:MAG: hypothetical protein ACRD20_19560 [Terriglobales bacterium]
MRVLAIIVLLAGSALGQVIALTGGSSSLLEGTGAGATLYFPSSTTYLAGGCSSTGCGFGIAESFRARGIDWVLGDRNFSANVAGGGAGVNVRGVSGDLTRGKLRLTAFLGGTGDARTTPFFQTGNAQKLGAGMALERKSGKWTIQGLAVLAGAHRSAAASARYVSNRFGFAGGGGLLNNQPFFSGQADFAAIPRHVIVSASRQQLYFPDAPTVTANALSASMSFGRFTAIGSAMQARVGTYTQQGRTLGGSVRLGPLTAQTNLYVSAGQRTIVSTLTEKIFRHFTATQDIAAHSLGFGGGYQSNRATISVNRSMLLFPLDGRGFVSVTTLSLSFRIRDAVVNLGSSVLPDGRVRYGVYGSDYTKGPLGDVALPHSSGPRIRSGAAVIRGKVLDRAGNPVMGAAVAVGRTVALTDTTGAFFVRVRNAKPVPVQVRLDEFSAPGTFAVVSVPDCGTPDAPVEIIVERN